MKLDVPVSFFHCFSEFLDPYWVQCYGNSTGILFLLVKFHCVYAISYAFFASVQLIIEITIGCSTCYLLANHSSMTRINGATWVVAMVCNLQFLELKQLQLVHFQVLRTLLLLYLSMRMMS